MKNFVFYCICFLLTSTSVFSQSTDEAAILKVLTTQQAAWNRGDLEGYMQGYWKSDSLTFIGKNGITNGWKQTLDNYKKSYADSVAMGKLDFEFVELKQLSPIYFFVTGRWQLTRTAGNISGSFTLLLRKIKGKWLIIKDHSS
jgi:ketosteroid isomerase-like protein